MKMLFDSNVIIDAVSSRPSSNESSRALFCLASSCECEGYLVAKQITDIYYTLRKYLESEMKRNEFIAFLLEAFNIIPLGKEDLQKAFALNMNDYEDAVLAASALRSGIDLIVSNNKKDFAASPVPTLLPQEALEKIQTKPL